MSALRIGYADSPLLRVAHDLFGPLPKTGGQPDHRTLFGHRRTGAILSKIANVNNFNRLEHYAQQPTSWPGPELRIQHRLVPCCGVHARRLVVVIKAFHIQQPS